MATKRIKDLTKVTSLSSSDVLAIDNTGGTKGITAQNAAGQLLQLPPIIWTGWYKNLGSSVTTAQHTAIANGTFEGLHLGDYWSIDGINYRIAAFDYYYNCGDTSDGAYTHHVVCVPDLNMGNQQMNSTNTTTGGWVGSEMWTTNLATARTKIKSAFGDRILTHRCYQVNAVSNGKPSAGAWIDTDIDLMNEQMVYGGFIFGSPGGDTRIIELKKHSWLFLRWILNLSTDDLTTG